MNPLMPSSGPLRWMRLVVAVAGACALMAVVMHGFTPVEVARGEPNVVSNSLQIDKTGPITALAGSLVTYTIAVTNDSLAVASGVIITDFWNTQLYSGTFEQSGFSNFTSFTYTTQTKPVFAQFNIATMADGEHGFITLSMIISPGGQPTYDANGVPKYGLEGNSAVITTSTPGLGTTNDRVDTTIAGPVFRLTKTITPSGSIKVRAGRLVTFTYKLENLNGPDTIPASGIIITERLPNNILFYSSVPSDVVTVFPATSTVQWNLTQTLPLSGTVYLTLTARVSPTQSGDATINNQKTMCAARANELPRFAYCDKDATFSVDFALDKVAFTQSPPAQSGPISKTYTNRVVTYTMYVYNPFPDPVTGMIVTDELPTYQFNWGPTLTFQYLNLVSSSPPTLPTVISLSSKLAAWQLPQIGGWGLYTFTFRAFVPPTIRIDDDSTGRDYVNGLRASSGSVAFVNLATNDDSLKVKVVPQTTFIKSVTPTLQTFGYPVTYTLSISNSGPTTITNMFVTDTLPTIFAFPTTYCAFQWDGWVSGLVPISTGLNFAAWGPITVTPYAQTTIGSFRAIVVGGPGDTCHNTVAGYSPDTFIVRQTQLAPVVVEVPFRYSKTVDRSSVILGGSIQYTVREWNVGSVDAIMDFFLDDLPPGFYYGDQTFYLDNLDAIGGTKLLPKNDLTGASAYETTFSVVVSQTSECDNLLPKTYNQEEGTFGMEIIQPTDPPLDGFWANAADAAPVTVYPQAKVTKSASPPGAQPGEVITFTITLSNNTSSLIDNLTVSDTLPNLFTYLAVAPGTPPPVSTITPFVIWQGISLTQLSTRALSFQVVAPAALSDGYQNNVKAYRPNDLRMCIPKLNPVLIVKVRKGSVEANKTATPSTVGPLSTFLYNISLTNKGPYTVTVNRFTETLPGGSSVPWTFVSMQTGDPAPDITNLHAPVWTNLTIGPDKVLNLRFNVRTATQVGDYPNYPYLTGNGNAGYMTASLPVNWVLTSVVGYGGSIVHVVPGVGLIKEVYPSTQLADQDVVYTITLVNVSNGTVNNIRVTDTLPSGFAFKEMVVGSDVIAPTSQNPLVFTHPNLSNAAPNNRLDIVFRAHISATEPTGTYFNSVVASVNETSIAPTGPTAPVVVSGQPTLNLSKSVTPTTVIAGRDVTYTLTLANPDTTDQTVINAIITDTLPVSFSFNGMVSADPAPSISGQRLIWTGISVPTNTVKTMIFRAHVAAGATDGLYYNQLNGSVSNIVFPGTGQTAPVTVIATPKYDVQVSKSDNAPTATIGGTVVYTIRYTNTVNTLGLTARNVVLTETFSPAAYLTTGAPGWNFVSSGVYTRLIGNLTSGQTGSVTFALSIDAGIPSQYFGITNTAQIGAQPPVDVPEAVESATSNNSWIDIDTIRGPDITVIGLSVSPATPQQGKTMTVFVTFKNQGVEATQGVPLDGGDLAGWFSADLYVKPANGPAPSGPADRYLGFCGDSPNFPPCSVMRFDLRKLIKNWLGVGLAPGETYVATYTYAIPTGGVQWLYVQADVYWGDPTGAPPGFWGTTDHGRILEADETNNVYGPIAINVRGNVYLPLIVKNK